MSRANRRPSDQHRAQAMLLPNAAVVYAVMQHVEETFEYLRSEDRLSLHSVNVTVALASVGQLMGLAESDIERLLNLTQKEPSFVLTGMSYSEFVDAVRCLAVLHGHLALEALPVLQVPDLSKALYNTYLSYSQALRPHSSGAVCRCRLVAAEPPPRIFWESFLRLSRDAGFVQPEGPLSLPALEQIWLRSSSLCDKYLPEHQTFAQFLRSLAVVSGQIKSEVFVPVAALGLAQEVPALRPVPNSYRLKHYKEVPLNLGGTWALPHLTFEALAKAVQEGRQYEYAQFLRDAQETANRDEAQRRQLLGGGTLLATADPSFFPSAADGHAGRTHGGAAVRRGGGGAAAAAAGANGRARPWSAGLTVLSPHPRRFGGAGKGGGASRTEADEGSAGTTGRSSTAPGTAAGVSPYAASFAAASSSTSARNAGDSTSLQGSRPAAPVHSGWLAEEPPPPPPSSSSYHAQQQQQQLQLLPSPRLLSPTSRALERSRSAASMGALPAAADSASPGGGWDRTAPPRGTTTPTTTAALPGVEGGGRVFLDSVRPRSNSHSTSFHTSSSPRVSLVGVQGGLLPLPPGPAAGAGSSAAAAPAPAGASEVPDGGGRSALSRLLSFRSASNTEAAPMGAGSGGVGSGTGMISPRGGGWSNGADAAAAMAVEYCAAGVRELRRDVEGRLGCLEEQGREVMALLIQLQSQVAALQQQQPQQQQPQQRQHEEPQYQQQQQQHVAAVGLLATAATAAAARDWGSNQQQQQQVVVMAAEGPVQGQWGDASRPPPSSPPRSRSPSRPSSAREDGSRSGDTARYGVVVRTSDVPGAGTDADVLLTIYGTKGDSGERLLSNGAYNFERGQVSTFVFTAADVGAVQSVRVRMRTQGSTPSASASPSPSPYSGSSPTYSPSWHLDALQVASSATGTRYRFPHSGWVDNVLGRECILHCRGTAPDTDGDPPGWQPTPPRLPGLVSNPQQSPPPSPPQQHRHLPQQQPQQQQIQEQQVQEQLQQQQPQEQEQQQQQAPGNTCGLLSPSPTLTPRGIEGVRQAPSPSPLSAAELPSPPSDEAAVSSPVAPPGFVRGVVHDAAMPGQQKQPQRQHRGGGEASAEASAARLDEVTFGAHAAAAAAAANVSGGGGGGSGGDRAGKARDGDGREDEASPPPPPAVVAVTGLMEERLAELQRRVQKVEEAQGDTAARAAAAIATAILARVPAPLLAAVRYGTAAAEAEAHRGVGADGKDSAVSLLAELLTHVHTMAEQGVTAAAAADTHAAAALDATRRQQSRTMQLQFEVSATSQAAEQAARHSSRVEERLDAALLRLQQRLQAEEHDAPAPGPAAPRSRGEGGAPAQRGGSPSGSELGAGVVGGVGLLAEQVRQCNAQLGFLAETVRQVTEEQSTTVAAAATQAEALAAEARAYQSRMAASLAELAASLASQRKGREEPELTAGQQQQQQEPAEADSGGGGDAAGLNAVEGDAEGGAGAEGGAAALGAALAAFKHELLQLAQAVAAGTGGGAGGMRGLVHPTEFPGGGVGALQGAARGGGGGKGAREGSESADTQLVAAGGSEAGGLAGGALPGADLGRGVDSIDKEDSVPRFGSYTSGA